MMARLAWIGTAAAVAVIGTAPAACERRKPAATDAAQQELERRQANLMAEMDRIAAQAAPADAPSPPPAAPADEQPAPAPQPDPASPTDPAEPQESPTGSQPD